MLSWTSAKYDQKLVGTLGGLRSWFEGYGEDQIEWWCCEQRLGRLTITERMSMWIITFHKLVHNKLTVGYVNKADYVYSILKLNARKHQYVLKQRCGLDHLKFNFTSIHWQFWRTRWYYSRLLLCGTTIGVCKWSFRFSQSQGRGMHAHGQPDWEASRMSYRGTCSS